jgi:hypothetical protein
MRRLTILTIAAVALGVFLVVLGGLRDHPALAAGGAAMVGYAAGLQHGLSMVLRAVKR